MILLVSDDSRDGPPLAAINFGWESRAFYAKWSGDRALAAEMASATLESFAPQGRHAEDFLYLVARELRDPAYLARIKRHYGEFRAAVEAGRFGGRISRLRRTLTKPAPLPRGSARIYQLKITLRGIRPPIWRRIQLRAEATLPDVHDSIQRAMGWSDSHLHDFEVGQLRYSFPHPDTDWMGSGDQDSRRVRLEEIAPAPKKKFRYRYDFGDDWVHEAVVEKILAPEAGARYPRCLAGARACPPEDCGGPYGYAYLLEILADANHPEHEERKEWIGGEWDPEKFDLAAIDRDLGALK